MDQTQTYEVFSTFYGYIFFSCSVSSTCLEVKYRNDHLVY